MSMLGGKYVNTINITVGSKIIIDITFDDEQYPFEVIQYAVTKATNTLK